MEIQTRYVLDLCEIEESTKNIRVRSRMQKWVVSGTNEILVEDNSGLHRIVLHPGDWSGADQWDVRKYADIIWTQDVINSWREKLSLRTAIATSVTGSTDLTGDVINPII